MKKQKQRNSVTNQVSIENELHKMLIFQIGKNTCFNVGYFLKHEETIMFTLLTAEGSELAGPLSKRNFKA